MIKTLTTESMEIQIAPVSCGQLLYVTVEFDIADNQVIDYTVTDIKSGYFNGVDMEKDQRSITEFNEKTMKEIDQIIMFHKLERENKI